MGGGSTTNTTNQTASNYYKVGSETTSPWSVQTPYLQQAFSRAEDAYNKTMQKGAYAGDYVAQGDARNDAAFMQAFGFGTDPTNNKYVQNQMDMANRLQGYGEDTLRFGGEGAKSLAGDQTDTIITNAGKYADNPYMAGALKAAMADAVRYASESAVPNLYRAGAGNNALMSDRAALGQGVVDRGLAEKAADLSGQMRYNAYDRGLGLSQDEINSRRQNYLNIGRFGQDTANLGITGLSQGIDNQNALNKMSIGGAEGLRAMRQLGLDNEMAKYQGEVDFPWKALQNYYSVIGDKSWGGQRNYSEVGAQQGYEQGTSQTKKQPGVTDVVGAGIGGIGSLFAAPTGGTSTMQGLASWFNR